MSIKIKELPEVERPYEKLELYGEKNLSNAELLAIIIKTGTKNETSVEIAQRILKLNYDPQMGDINFLRNMSLKELMQIKGIGRVKAIQLKAVCELGVRMSRPSNYKKIKVKNSTQVGKILLEEMKLQKKEYAKLILLNSANEILKIVDVAVGGTGFVNINIKDVIMEAIKIQAPRIILAHNHPSGDPTPSIADIKFTDKLYKAAASLDIDLIDHIIIGDNKVKSIYEELMKRNKTIDKKDV